MYNSMCAMSRSILGVLLIWFLQVGFVHCVQPRLNVTEHDILKTLFDSTGGSTGRWNYAGMETCLTQDGGSILIGRDWNFTKNAAGAYLDDPCQNDATSTKPFTGVYCACDAASCVVKYLVLPCGDLSGPIPEALGDLAQLQQLVLSDNNLTGTVPSELANLQNLTVLLLQNNSLVTSSVSNNAFSFINPQNFTKLNTLDVSNNEFTGTIPESIFELPALKVFAAGSNCFSGFLPANICNATKLETIAISGLSTADSCKHYFWKGTAFSGVFNGYGAKHFMEGSLPQCIYSLPNMRTVHAAGNSFLGEAPFSGEDKSGLKISPLLGNIDVARNRLTGYISPQLVTAAKSEGKLRSLDMSYNRIRGNLSIFAGNAETYVNTSNPLNLQLQVNHLSGDIPASLLSLKSISLLAGNVFWCSYSRVDLPAHNPKVESYQCGSDNMNTMLIAFGAVVVVILMVIQAIRLNRKMQHYVGRMKLWLDVAEGRRAIDKDIQITHMKRYSDYFRDLRYFVLMIGLAMIVVFIVYVSLAGRETRTITHAYTWVTTAAYLSGETSTILLLDVCICMTGLTWYLITENRWGAAAVNVRDKKDILLKKAKIHRDEGEEEGTRWIWLRIRSLPALRVIVLIVVIWGVLIGGNVLYLHILLNGTPDEQETFKFAFAAFKLVWTIGVTNHLFSSNFLYFGLEEEHHVAFISTWLGGKVKMMFVFNAISSFWIPILTIMVVRPECFYNAFIAADPVPVSFEYSAHVCLTLNSAGKCQFTQHVHSDLDVPFVYNYTCSPSILRAYVPLYQQMFLLLIVRSALQLFYFCSDIDESESIVVEQKLEENSSLMSIVSCFSDRLKGLVLAGILKTMPTKHLMYNSNQRQALHKVGDERVFSAEPSVWITKPIPAHLGAVVILLTFAVLAPLLALSIILYIVLDTYISQMVLGRFLVTQLGVIMEYKRGINLSDYYDSIALNPNEAIFVSPNKRARIRQDIEDATQPWGALAALKEVEAQCRHMPASTMDIGRSVFVIAPAITMAFTANDVLNNTRDDHKFWPSVLLLCLALALEVFTIAYNRYYAAHKHSENNQEPFKQKVDKKEKGVETRHSIELQVMSHAQELEMDTRAFNVSACPFKHFKHFFIISKLDTNLFKNSIRIRFDNFERFW